MKALVLARLRRTRAIGPDSAIATEFRLGNGVIRADLAIASKTFIGVEVKSELDSLRRLPSQIEAYGQNFERLIIAVASKHIKGLNACSVGAAGIWSFDEHGNIEVIRAGEINKPSSDYQHLLCLRKSTRMHCNDHNNENASNRDIFFSAFHARYRDTSRSFWKQVSGKTIEPEDLLHLRRGHEADTLRRKFEQERAATRAAWCDSAAKYLMVA